MCRICDALLFKSSFPTGDQFVSAISSASTAGNPWVRKILCDNSFVCFFVCCCFFLQLSSYIKYKIKTEILTTSWRLCSISLWMFRICDTLLFKSSFPTWDQFLSAIASALMAGILWMREIFCFVIICLLVCLFVVAFFYNYGLILNIK